MNTLTENPKITIIMPAFNAEEFIEPSIRSILNQTYKNIELIVVNDGSTDKTVEIVSQLALEDSRITLMTVDNCGPANARNVALDSLDGSSEFIMFCDADDIMKSDMVETAILEALTGADFVITGFTIVNADGRKNNYYENDQRLDTESIGKELGNLYKANLLNQVWGKVFRSDIIFDRTIRFPDYRWGEDRFFVFNYLNSSHNVSVLSYCGYEYIMHPGQSLITSFFKNKADICVLIDERMEELCRKFNVEDESPFRYMFAKSIFSCIANLYSPNCTLSYSEKRKYVRGIISNSRILSRCKGTKGNWSMEVILFIISTGSVTLTLLVAKISAFVSKVFPNTFRKLKHKK